MPWIGGALSAGASLGSSLFGGGNSTSPSNAPKPYQLLNQQGMNLQGYSDNTNSQNLNSQTYGTTSPYGQAAFQSQANNPYAQQYQNSANMAGQAGMASGWSQLGAGNSMMAEAPNSYAAGNAAYQTAFDPQSSLFNSNQQQLNEQTNAYNAANGISASPYGATVSANADQNFLNNWQNQQVQREATGIQSMNSAYAQGGQQYQGGAQLQNQGTQSLSQGGQMGYNANNSIAGNQFSAINNLYGSQQPYQQGLQQGVNNMNSYLGLGQSAQTAGFNQNLQTANYQNQQSAAQGQYYGNLAGQAGNAYSQYQNGQNFNNSWNNATNQNMNSGIGNEDFYAAGGNGSGGAYGGY
jgi:hypothetical protein